MPLVTVLVVGISLSLADTILFQLNSARAQAKDMRTPLGMVSHKGDTFMLFQLVGRRG
jgi:hypothetical protein